MKHFAFVAIVLLGLTISCTSAAMPQLQATIVTATPTSMPTITPPPTSTSAAPVVPPTTTATVTPSLTPRPTATRTPLPPPTEQVTRGKPIFTANWNGELGPGWSPVDEKGKIIRDESVAYDFVPDPQDNSRQVIRYTVTGSSVPITRWGDQYWQNSYATRDIEPGTSASAVEVKFLFPPDFSGDIGLLGGHGQPDKKTVTGIQMNTASKRIFGYTFDGMEAKTYRTDTVLEPNKWHTLRIEYRNDKTYFLVNGEIVYTVDFKFQAMDLHAGWQFASKDPKIFHKIGEWMMQKDFVVESPN